MKRDIFRSIVGLLIGTAIAAMISVVLCNTVAKHMGFEAQQIMCFIIGSLGGFGGVSVMALRS